MPRLTAQLLPAICVFAACTSLDSNHPLDGGIGQSANPASSDGEVVLEGGSLQTGPDANVGGSATGSPCTDEGALRCSAAGAGARELCTAQAWSAAQPCATGQVCQDKAGAASCQAVAEVCKGSAGMAVCDGQGVLYRCDATGVAEGDESCKTPQLCQLGLAGRKCLVCKPNEFRCSGTMLERCNADGMAFMPVKSCDGAAMCNASVGDCSQQACLADHYRCQGDTLQRCNASQTAYETLKTCKAGLCDETQGQCDECVAGSKSCEGDFVASCSADGQALSRAACPEPTSQCVGVGQCAQCGSDADCPDPGVCKTRHCNLAAGTCEPGNQPAKSMCPTGMCDGSGGCGACNADSDCPNPGDCQTRFCNKTTHACEPKNMASGVACSAGFCNATGACVGCTSATQCTAMTCQTAACTNSKCVYTPTPAGTRGSCPSGQVCSASASCVQCTADAQCTGGSACSQARCMNNQCTTVSLNGKQCGTRKVCEGSSCVNSCGNGVLNVDAQEDCEVGLSGATDWSCDRVLCKRTGLPNTGLGINCMRNSECPSGLICDATLAGGANGVCTVPCGLFDTPCTLPTGYTSNGCNVNMYGSAYASGCFVNCNGAGRCPAGAVCSGLSNCLAP
jgi:hypothetical protein